jgi:hypothetical protein
MILESEEFQVLAETCTYQDNESADYLAYCDDGMKRRYTIYAYCMTPINVYEEELMWTTSNGEKIKASEIKPSHRKNIINLLQRRLRDCDDDFQKGVILCQIIAFS